MNERRYTDEEIRAAGLDPAKVRPEYRAEPTSVPVNMTRAQLLLRAVNLIADQMRQVLNEELEELEKYGAEAGLKEWVGSSVIDRLAGRPFSVPTESDDAVECSEGCPIVIFIEEWDYHARWHRSEDEREAHRRWPA